MPEPGSGDGIYELELSAVVLAVCIAVAQYTGRPNLVFCDNEGANGAAKRGSCSPEMGLLL